MYGLYTCILYLPTCILYLSTCILYSPSPLSPLSNKPLDRLDDAAVEPPSAWLITYSTEGLAQLRVAVDPAVQGGYG